MKQRLSAIALLLAAAITASAQFAPEDYTAVHMDSSWYFTFDYDIPKPSPGEGMLIVTHLCTPDTCISTAERHIQGKRYAKRYVKKHHTQPTLQQHGPSSVTLTLPENEVSDTMYGVTYCEFSDRFGTQFTSDTFTVYLPDCLPMSCHRVAPNKSIADHIAAEHPHVRSIKYYTPLTNGNAADGGNNIRGNGGTKRGERVGLEDRHFRRVRHIHYSSSNIFMIISYPIIVVNYCGSLKIRFFARKKLYKTTIKTR